MSAAHNHWVEDMFPPTFGYTTSEILEGPNEDITRKPQSNVFQQVAQGKISPLDVSAIKNVYERVWLMTYLETKGKEKEDAERKTDEEQHLSRSSRSATTVQDKAVGTSTSFTKQQGYAGDCIWSTKEIEVLREVFKEAKSQNVKLNATLHETQSHLRRSDAKYKSQYKMLETRTKHLNEAKKANERLKILSDNLKSHLDKSESTVELLHDEIKELRKTQLNLSKDVHRLRLQLDKERIKHEHLELDSKQHHQKAQRDLELREEQLKIQHAEDIEFLNKQLKELKTELEGERQDHARTKRGLDHLRTHFANVPLHGEAAVVQGAVNQNELAKWTY